MRVVRETHFGGISPAARGKVRDIYDLGDKLLIVRPDRLSAFDVVLPTPIPDKGRVLTQLSLFWFELLRDVIPNHVLSATDFPAAFDTYRDELAGRSMVVRKDAASADRMRCARLRFRFGMEGLSCHGKNLRDRSAAGCENPTDCRNQFLRPRRKRRLGMTKIFRSNEPPR